MRTNLGAFAWDGTSDPASLSGWSETLQNAKLYQLDHAARRTAQKMGGVFGRLIAGVSINAVEVTIRPRSVARPQQIFFDFDSTEVPA